MKKISCGLLIHNGDELLTVHPTYAKKWDIPKGELDENETFEQTVLREVKEETNLDIPNDKIRLLGKFEYLKHKDLILFEYKVDELPNISNMKCESTFMLYGTETPEVDNYMYRKIKDVENSVWPNLGKIIKSLELNKNESI